MTALLVVIGGALGAPLRFVLDGEVRRLLGDRWPGGTLLVNVLGAFLLGLVARFVTDGGADWLLALVGTGVCGALTTFSTFSYDVFVLLERRAWLGVVAYLTASLVLGSGAFWLGWGIAG